MLLLTAHLVIIEESAELYQFFALAPHHASHSNRNHVMDNWEGMHLMSHQGDIAEVLRLLREDPGLLDAPDPEGWRYV